MKPYYQDDQVTLYHGGAAGVLADLGAGSVDCIVTSPPYFGLRDYGVDGQLGAEPSPAEFVSALVDVFREARRVLADDGTLWLNLGDSYAGSSGFADGEATRASSTLGGSKQQTMNARPSARHDKASVSGPRTRGTGGLPAKNLLGIPWRVAFALQDDGWILRNDIIWHKLNAMPESVTDRLSGKHEHLFLFSKSRRYWFDLDPIRESIEHPGVKRTIGQFQKTGDRHNSPHSGPLSDGHALGKNPGDVWVIPTQPFTGAHFAVFPVAIPERAIKAGCKPGGTVLDPFSGSGTTGLAAAKHGRRYIGIDLNAEYLDLSLRTRLLQPALDFASLTQEPA